MEQVGTLPIIEQYLTIMKRNLGVVQQNAEGLSGRQALTTLWEGGSHFNWLVGHLTHSRCGLLRILGHEAPWSGERGERYGFGSTPPSATEAEPFEALLAAYASTQVPLEAAFEGLTAADLERALASGRGTVGGRLEFLVWHESYHSGQSSLYRRVAGLDRVIP